MSAGPAGPTVWLVDPRAHVPEYDRSLAAALERLGCRVRSCVGPSWAGSQGAVVGVSRQPPEGRRRGRVTGALRHPIDLIRLVRQVHDERPDVVHWQWSVEPPLDAMAMCAIRGTGAATVLTLHNVLPHERRTGQRAARVLLVPRADAVIVHSHATARRLERVLGGAGRGRTTVVPMSADPPTGSRPSRREARRLLGLDLAAGDRLVLFFGQIRPYKGLRVLLEALDLCRRVDGRVHLLVAGHSLDRDRPLGSGAWNGPGAGSLRPAGGVFWRSGVRPEEEVPVLFAACDLVALPYLRTDDSAVLPQALAHGRAVVASAVGGLPEALSRGGGELVPSGDAPALSRALLGLLTDEGRLRRLEAAAAAAASAWTWDDAALATCRVYAGLLVGPGAAGRRT